MSENLYDLMAEHYHLIFQDWDASMRRQGAVISKLLPPPEHAGRVLDGACGIGTQALALASLGYAMEGSDLSAVQVARARREALTRGLQVEWRIDDIRVLNTASAGGYGAVINMDNALPHLDSDDDISKSLDAMHTRLKRGGTLLVSVRDYERLLLDRPTSTPPVFFDDGGRRRIVFQVWDWIDKRRYVVHIHITRETEQGWEAHHFVGRYRAITPAEVADLAREAGFADVKVLPPEHTGYHQPIIIGTATA